MKILQLIPNLAGGGAERLVVDLSNQLSKKHDIVLLTMYNSRKDDLFRDQINPNVKTLSLGKKLGYDWSIIPRLYKTIRSVTPDIVHNHLRSFNYLMPSIPLIRDLPFIHTVHNDAFKECANSKIRFLRKQFYKQMNVKPVTISKESAGSFEKAYMDIDHSLIYNGRRFPKKSENFDIVVNEIERFKKNRETKIFVNIGRQEKQKNQLMLVKAFNRLVYEDGANAILIIIGGGRDNKASRTIQQELKKTEQMYDHIHILGECSNATDYLHVSNYFCLSSIYEGMPITLIEAIATGSIPVCTPVGGVPEMVCDLEYSLLAESTEVDDYYKVLKRAYALRDEKQVEIKKRAKSLFKEKYSMEHCAKEYLKLYEELVNKK